ncbi:hypothetical protein PAPYR_3642 [Paratrimastix pyriformis]|uniref:Tetratricopeptide repeat protein n=1 Tax=Paratrimastix pyriformis TaxID=342808 RepID=A0ABQ8UPN9_9EUKA|nr:hypothetical protein PAPYR_3642 [Paratrimastix pyriformis]
MPASSHSPWVRVGVAGGDEQATALDPSNLPARKRLAAIYHGRMQYLEAEQAYLDILKHHPTNLGALFGLCRLYSAWGLRRVAVRILSWALQAFADLSESLRLLLSDVQENENALLRASALFTSRQGSLVPPPARASIQRAPPSPPSAALARSLATGQQSALFPNGAPDVPTALGRWAKRRYSSTVARLHPTHPELHIVALFRRAPPHSPPRYPCTRPIAVEAQRLVRRPSSLSHGGRSGASTPRGSPQPAPTRPPTVRTPPVDMVAARQKSARRVQDFLALEDPALLIQRQLAVEAYLTRAAVLDRQAEGALAMADYSQALLLDPSSTAAYLGRAGLTATADPAEAWKDLCQCLDMEPANVSARVARARLALQQGRPAAARRDYERALLMGPPMPRPLLEYAQLLADRPARPGDLARVLIACNGIVREWPGTLRAVLLRARCLQQMGQPHRALRDLARARHLAPWEPSTSFLLWEHLTAQTQALAAERSPAKAAPNGTADGAAQFAACRGPDALEENQRRLALRLLLPYVHDRHAAAGEAGGSPHSPAGSPRRRGGALVGLPPGVLAGAEGPPGTGAADRMDLVAVYGALGDPQAAIRILTDRLARLPNPVEMAPPTREGPAGAQEGLAAVRAGRGGGSCAAAGAPSVLTSLHTSLPHPGVRGLACCPHALRPGTPADPERAILGLDDEIVDLYFQRAQCRMRLGQHAKALDDIAFLLQVASPSPRPPRCSAPASAVGRPVGIAHAPRVASRAGAHYQRGLCLLELGRYGEAEEALATAIDSRAAFARACCMRGMARFMCLLDRAVRAAALPRPFPILTIVLSGGQPALVRRLYLCNLHVSRRYAAARQRAATTGAPMEALAGPGVPTSAAALAEAFQAQFQESELLSGALDDFGEALRHDRRLPWGHLGRALVFEALGMMPLAREACDAALSDDPNLFDAFVYRALAEAQTGGDEAALALNDYTSALRLRPTHVGALFNRSLLWEALGRPREALHDAEEALRLAPYDPGCHMLCARAHLAAREYRQAAGLLERYLALVAARPVGPPPSGGPPLVALARQLQEVLDAFNMLAICRYHMDGAKAAGAVLQRGLHQVAAPLNIVAKGAPPRLIGHLSQASLLSAASSASGVAPAAPSAHPLTLPAALSGAASGVTVSARLLGAGPGPVFTPPIGADPGTFGGPPAARGEAEGEGDVGRRGYVAHLQETWSLLQDLAAQVILRQQGHVQQACRPALRAVDDGENTEMCSPSIARAHSRSLALLAQALAARLGPLQSQLQSSQADLLGLGAPMPAQGGGPGGQLASARAVAMRLMGQPGAPGAPAESGLSLVGAPLNQAYVALLANLGATLLARQRPVAAARLYGMALRYDPCQPALHELRALALSARGDGENLTRALGSLGAALQLTLVPPGDPALVPELRSDAFLPAKAEVIVGLLADRDLQAPLTRLLTSRATALQGLGRLSDAICDLAVAAQLCPHAPEPLFCWGNVFLRQRLLPQAVTHYQKAMALQPGHRWAQLNSGVAQALIESDPPSSPPPKPQQPQQPPPRHRRSSMAPAPRRFSLAATATASPWIGVHPLRCCTSPEELATASRCFVTAEASAALRAFDMLIDRAPGPQSLEGVVALVNRANLSLFTGRTASAARDFRLAVASLKALHGHGCPTRPWDLGLEHYWTADPAAVLEANRHTVPANINLYSWLGSGCPSTWPAKGASASVRRAPGGAVAKRISASTAR